MSQSYKYKHCDKCKYNEKGKCHRYPCCGTGFTADYPTVSDFDWCGEFQPRDIEPEIPQEISEPQQEAQNGDVKRRKTRKAD